MTDPGAIQAPPRFAGRTVLITGAASGFGRAAALRFADEGARLALADWDGPALSELARRIAEGGTEVLADQVDVRDEAEMAAFTAHVIERFDALDVAVNNAGLGGRLAPLAEQTVEEFDRILAVNARGVFLGMKHQIPPMAARGGGVILNMASAAGLVGAGMMAPYAASKHAVVGLTRSAADELARDNIRVNALCPSFAATPLFETIAEDYATSRQTDRSQVDARITARIPMKRLADQKEVVNAILWLCSEENSFMTGQAVALDGGLTAI